MKTNFLSRFSALPACSVAAVSGRSATSAVQRFFQLLVACYLLLNSATLVAAAIPQWWITRGVINTNLPPDNYAAVNQGQLKHIAYQAFLELEEKLPGGAGDMLKENVIPDFFQFTNGHYAPVNGGQLKNVAKPFYDRLIEEGYAQSYPWTETKADDANFAMVNIGQVKHVFSFDLDNLNPNPPPQVDGDGDGLDDNWEKENFGNLTPEPDDDMDGDGIPNSQEQQDGTDPNEPDEDPENPLPPIASYGLIHWQPVNHELGDSDALYATWQVFVNDKGQAIATTAGQGVGVWTTAFAKGSVTQELDDYMCYNFNNEGQAILETSANEDDEGDGFVYQVWDFESGDFSSAPPINSPPSLLPDDLEVVYSMDVIIDQIICEGSVEEKTSLLGINDQGNLAGTTVFQWRVKYHTYYYDQVSKQWKQSNGEKIINDFRPVYWSQGQVGNVMPVNEDFMETYSYLHTANINNQDAVALMKEGSQFLYYSHASEEPQTLDLPWDTRSRLNNEAQVAGSFYQGKSYATVSKANGPVQALGKGQAIGIAPQGELITGSLLSGQQQQTLLKETTDKTPAIYQASLRHPTTQKERFPVKQRPKSLHSSAKNLQNAPLTPSENMMLEEALLWKKNQENGKYVRQKVETMLEKTSLAQDWHVQTLHNPNKYGIIGGVGYYKDQPQYLTMMPAELGVDANRDGKIVLLNEKDLPGINPDDLDRTTGDKPFKYWTNEDNDEEDTVFCVTYGNETEEDDLNTGNHDNDDTQIAYKRDLEDFTRLWVYLKGVHEMVKGDNAMLVGLKFKDITEGDPQIRLFEAVEEDGGVQYLDNENTADQQIQGQYGQAIEAMFSGNTVVNSQEPFILPSEIWDELDEENYKKYFLFEGVSEGKGKLQIVFLNQDQEEIGEAPPIYLEITDIKKMYERYTLGENPDLEPALNPSLVGDAYPAPEEDYEKDYVLFVHGYNMPSWEKDRWAETVFKRLWHQNYKGRVGILKWPCTTPGCLTSDLQIFDHSEFRAWQSGQGLQALLNQLNGSYYGGRVRVLAHSQGNVVVGEALRRAGPGSGVVHTYVASQAAIPAHCYDDTTPSMPPSVLPKFPTTPNVYGNYWQNGLAQHIPAVWPIDTPSYLDDDYMAGAAVNFVNYYNPQDYALAPGVWQADQKLKPNNAYHYSVGDGFQFDSMVPFDERDLQFPDDRFEIFSFAAESHSFALGAQEGVGGVFTLEVNLNAEPYSYEELHVFHSAQFRSFLARRHHYWKSFLLSSGLNQPE